MKRKKRKRWVNEKEVTGGEEIMERTGEGKLEEIMGKEGGTDEEGIKEEVWWCRDQRTPLQGDGVIRHWIWCLVCLLIQSGFWISLISLHNKSSSEAPGHLKPSFLARKPCLTTTMCQLCLSPLFSPGLCLLEQSLNMPLANRHGCLTHEEATCLLLCIYAYEICSVFVFVQNCIGSIYLE